MSFVGCSIEGCGRPHLARGWCGVHYTRWYKHGDPLGGAPDRPRGASMSERFWAKVNKDGPVPEDRPDLGPCWEWTASQCGGGYGRLVREGKRGQVLAHRFAYELLVGPIPEGLHIDHLCRNRACVNPAHLEPVTNAENVRRGETPAVNRRRGRAKTHCPQGHPYDEANTLWGAHGRQCRQCQRERQRERRKGANHTNQRRAT